MKNDLEMDELLKEALKMEERPDITLNQQILEQAEKKEKKRAGRWLPRVAVAAAAVLIVSGTVMGAGKFLTYRQVAEQMEEKAFTKAFSGKDAVEVNETVTDGNYQISFLGMTSGKELSNLENADIDVQVGSIYAIVAIARTDGVSMENYWDNSAFFVSPLIKGLEPWQYNIASMNGSYTEQVIDGILYRIIQCDNVEVFADRTLYLSVSDTVFYSNEAFSYDEATGDISVNEEYDGVNVLFSLPVDKSKANEEKAGAYLQELQEEWETDSEKADSEEAGAEQEDEL